MRTQKLNLVVSLLLPLTLYSDAPVQGPMALLSKADRLAMLYNWPEAAPLYTQAESLFKQSGDKQNALAARLGYLWATADAGVTPAAVQETSAYLKDPLVQTNQRLLLRAFIAKAVLDRNTNETASRELWDRILKLATALDDDPWEARAKAELGQILYLDGDIKSAAAMLRAAILSLYLHLDLGAAIHYTAMVGNGFVEAGQPEAALQYCNIALRASRVVPDIGFPYLAYQGKARALLALNRNHEGESVLNEALTRAEAQQNYMALSQLLIVSGKIETLNRANEISQTRGFQHIFAWSAFELARAYRNAGDLDSAEAMAAKAIAIMREVEDRNHLPQHLNLLADLEARKGNFDRADQLYSEAADVIDALLVNITRRQLKSSLIATLSDAYVGHFELAATKFADVHKAYEIIETARGRALADTLRGEAESLTSSSDQVSIEAEREINRIQVALMHRTSRTERQSLLDQLFAQEQLLMPVPQTRSLVKSAGDRGKPVPLRTVQSLLGRDEMLLEYVLGDAQSYCLQITRASAVVLVIPSGRKRIEMLVTDYLRGVRSRERNISAGGELFRLLLEPAIEKSSMTKISVVPDGSLHLLPFDALKTPDEKYVLEKYVVTYTPSATVLHLLRQSRPADRPGMNFLGIGDVIYPRPTAATSSANIDPENDGPDFFNVNAVTFPDLPGSRQELTAVAGIIKGEKQLLLGPNATEGAFKAAPLSDYSIIHFAVHGLGNAQFPDRAALVLGSSPSRGEDGLLQVREIRDLPLRADLVVLSACDTGNGRLLGEEGIASLERAFLLAGAKAVIASLWTTDDTYTIALMRRLYQHLVAGIDKGLALRQAKADLLQQFGDQALPVYWAGFTLVGDSSTALLN